jgi:ubiquinone/menaquinone biosynthesis C-methylase UbiE
LDSLEISGGQQTNGDICMKCVWKKRWSYWPAAALIAAVLTASGVLADSVYVYGEATRDGTGKYYMGREIAQVMGHRGADWLERSDRKREEAPDVLVRNLELSRTDIVADIGAGTGYFTFRLSALVPDGTVFAVDIQEEMLDIISDKMSNAGVDNVIPVLGKIDDPRLPDGGIDLVLLVDAYHEFSHPREMMLGIYRALRPGGRIALIEYRLEDPEIPIKRLHKMSEEQMRAEVNAVGFEWAETKDFLPRQHFMVFQKPETEN